MTADPADRARAYRRRQGVAPRKVLGDPLNRARRRLRAGERVADLTPIEADVLRAYQRRMARARRTASCIPHIEDVS